MGNLAIFFQFQLADIFDIIMIILATLMSIASGMATPVESYLTGRLFNVFISYKAAQPFSFAPLIINGSCTTTAVQEILTNATNMSLESLELFCDVSEEGNALNSASNFICDPDQTLVEETTTLSIGLAILAAVLLLTRFLSNFLWTLSAYRQSRRMRIAFYQSVLRQEIGWFETNDTSKLRPLYVK